MGFEEVVVLIKVVEMFLLDGTTVEEYTLLVVTLVPSGDGVLLLVVGKPVDMPECR